MTKELRKAVMNRSKLRNRFLKTRNEESKKHFNHQRNFYVNLLCKTKILFLRGGGLDHRVVSDNRKVSEIVGPLFSKKVFHKNLSF